MQPYTNIQLMKLSTIDKGTQPNNITFERHEEITKLFID